MEATTSKTQGYATSRHGVQRIVRSTMGTLPNGHGSGVKLLGRSVKEEGY